MQEQDKRNILLKIDELEYKLGEMKLDIDQVSENAGASVDLSTKQDVLTAGNGITIQNNVISTNIDLSTKQDVLTAGDNITITNGTISATNTTYSAGTGISIDSNNVISSTGGGLSQEQATQLSTVYDYYTTHHTEHDENYSGETFTDYPAGTIFQIADSFVQEYDFNTHASLTFPTIFFSAEAGSVGTVNIMFDYKVQGVATNFNVNISLNGTVIYNQAQEVASADVEYTFNRVFTADLSATGDNKIVVTLSLQGASNSNRTLLVNKIEYEVSAPNAVIHNKLCPFDAINIDGTYYIADSSGDNVKTAVISQNNMFNINSLSWNQTQLSANVYKFVPKLTLYDNIYQTSDVAYFYQDKSTRFHSCYDTSNYDLLMPSFICCDYSVQKSENISYMACRFNASSMIKYNHFISSNGTSETTGKSGTGNCAKLIGARMLGNYYLNMSSIPNVMILIDQSGQAVLHGSISGTYGTYSLGTAQDATLYLKNVIHNGNFAVECYVRKFDKIVKYDLYYMNRTFTLVSQTVMGYYDKFFKMNDTDYFVVKNNQLKFYRLEQE